MSHINFAAETAIPPDDAMNSGLSPAGKVLMNHFGRPGPLRENCSAITNPKLKALIVTRDVGPFRVTGLKPAVASLERIFTKVEERDKELYKAIKTAGMLCCRLIRGSQSTFSIHSWGAAIDLYCGSGIVPLGRPTIHVGVLRLYPYLHNEGWYDGSEFTRRDSMHKEVSRQKLIEWINKGWI